MGDEALAELSSTENRILLTRDVGLLKRRIVSYGYFVRITKPRLQIFEIISRYKLQQKMLPFTRCTVCNGKIERVSKARIINKIDDKTKKYYQDFWHCNTCERVYWQGSHFQKLNKLIEEIRVSALQGVGDE